MKQFISDSKTIIVEIAGIFGGFFWAKSINWDYEPLILFIVSVISFIISLIFLLSEKSDKNKSIKIVDIENKSSNKDIIEVCNIVELDAKDIANEINNSLPYLEENIKSSYLGLSVKWIVRFDSLRKLKDNKYHVTTLYKGNYPWVYFDIDIEEYPFFKIARKKQAFKIAGKIIEIGGNTFTISVENIQI
ncbi:MAG TPA: hypothetical protein VIK55_04755 [Paludibacter sp.]